MSVHDSEFQFSIFDYSITLFFDFEINVMCTMNVLSDSSRRKPLRVVKINVFSRNLVRSFLIVFVFCEIFFLQNCVDAQTHNPAYDRRAATLNRRNRLALQRNAVVNLTDLGTLQGSIDETKWTRTPIYRFLGVKYGESPSGNRRFKVMNDRWRFSIRRTELKISK